MWSGQFRAVELTIMAAHDTESGATSVARTRTGTLVAWSCALFDAHARDGVLALVDQALFSGTSFLTTIIVGRMSTRHDLGTYSLGFSIIMIVICIENALIASPYTVYVQRLQGRHRGEYSGSVLVHCLMLSGLAVIFLALSACVLSLGIGPPGLGPVVWALASVIPFRLVRQFAREFTFAHLNLVRVLLLDALVAAVQLGGICYLAFSGRLSAVSAHVMVGLACAAGAAVWFAFARPDFAFRWARVAKAFWRDWVFGRWVLASQMSLVLHSSVMYWVLALRLGIAATGVLAACDTVVALSNPFILGMNNYLGPRIARAFAEGGRPRIRRVVVNSALFLAGVMAAGCVFVALFGGRLVCLLYGEEYAGHEQTVTVLALAVFTSVLAQAPSLGLLAMERSDVAFRLRLLGLSVTTLAGFCLVRPFGVDGAAYALLGGHLTTAIVTCFAYRKVVMAEPGRTGPAPDVPLTVSFDCTFQTSNQ